MNVDESTLAERIIKAEYLTPFETMLGMIFILGILLGSILLLGWLYERWKRLICFVIGHIPGKNNALTNYCDRCGERYE